MRINVLFSPRLTLLITGYYYYAHIPNLSSLWSLDIFDRVYVKELFGLNKFYTVDLQFYDSHPELQIHRIIVFHREYRILEFSSLFDILNLAEPFEYPFPLLSPRHDERYNSTVSDAWMWNNPGTLPKSFCLLSCKNDSDVQCNMHCKIHQQNVLFTCEALWMGENEGKREESHETKCSSLGVLLCMCVHL